MNGETEHGPDQKKNAKMLGRGCLVERARPRERPTDYIVDCCGAVVVVVLRLGKKKLLLRNDQQVGLS